MQIVYGLEDPRERLFHYVGITDDVYARFIAHIKGSGGNIEKNGWIFECRQDNIMIFMHQLERIELRSMEQELVKASEREKYWVKHYLDLGHPLSNMRIAQTILKEQAKLGQQVVYTPKKSYPSSRIKSQYTTHLFARSLEEVLKVYQPGMSHRALARILEVSHPTAGKYIQQLRKTGMIG